MRFLLLPMWKKAFLLRCLLIVAAMRIGLNVVKFDRLRRLTVPPAGTGRADVDYLKRVAWGVSRTARYVPRATCLTQALAGQYLLSRRGISSSIRLGVNRSPGEALRAHAWLVSGGFIVLGGESHALDEFHHLADFGPAL